MVNGSSPGPAPAAQARASTSRLTRSNWRAWPHRKLRRNVPSVDGALTTQPSTRSVSPARSASASSMQSPPASADAHQGQQLVSRIGPTRCISQIDMAVHQFTQSQMMGQRDRQDQPSIGHQAVIIEDSVDAVGGSQVVASDGCSSFQGGFRSQKPLSPKPGALSHPITTPPHSSFRWIGV